MLDVNFFINYALFVLSTSIRAGIAVQGPLVIIITLLTTKKALQRTLFCFTSELLQLFQIADFLSEMKILAELAQRGY